jgi:hypothetical protein
MKLFKTLFLLCSLGFCINTFCTSKNESIDETKDVYDKLINLTESFKRQILTVKEKKEAIAAIDRFINERDKLFARFNDIERKYPDFRQDPSLKEFENTLGNKTREAVSSGIDSVQRVVPVNNLKELGDLFEKKISRISDKTEKK